MKQEECEALLAGCTDFLNEKSALDAGMTRRGHILQMSPKGHPELAGVGIEYSWGKFKMTYRRDNDCIPANLHKNIAKSLNTEEVLTLGRVRQFARKMRDYVEAYKSDVTSNIGTSSHSLVEKLKKVHKTHRCTMDQVFKFIQGV